MALSKKKLDPLSDRARDLNQEIAALEAEIKRLSSAPAGHVPTPATGPKFRSTATPGMAITSQPKAPATPPTPAPTDPVFEDVRHGTVAAPPATEAPELFNEMGVRKYDLPALFHRLRDHFRPPTTSNPRLISYLASGGVQGLRPLRREKRVARDRFIVLVLTLLLALSGLLYLIFRGR